MQRRLPGYACLLIALIAILLQPAGVAAQATSQPAGYPYPDTVDGLTIYFKQMLEAADKKDDESLRRLMLMSQLLVMPKSEEWFTHAFDKELGLKLNAKYIEEMKDFGPKLARLFFQLLEPAKLTVSVTKVEASDDPNARAYQMLALEAMVKPVPLYSVNIRKEGTAAAIQVWSIVNEKGIFRMVGHMEGVYEKASSRKPTTTP